jgi:hypothetical protein
VVTRKRKTRDDDRYVIFSSFLSLRGITNHVDSAQPKASRLSERISRIEQALANSFPELDAGMKHSTEMAVVYLIQISNAGFLPDANAG